MSFKKYFCLEQFRAYLLGLKRGRSIFLGFFFILSLTLCLQFQQPYIGCLTLNQKAEENISCSIAFLFPDTEATNLIRQESLRDVGQIYAFHSREVFENEQAIERELIEDGSWRDRLPEATFELLYECKNALREQLFHVRFAKEGMIQKMKEISFSTDNYIPCQIQGDEGVILSERIWDEIQKKASLSYPFSESILRYVIQKFISKEWGLWEDFQTQNKIRQEIKMSIPLKLTKIQE